MAKYVAQLVIAGAEVLGRALGKALKEEIRASQQAAKARAAQQGGPGAGARRSAADAYTGLTLGEAKQILNVDSVEDMEKVTKSYEHLFAVNDKAKGGSFYIQSKVVRAKERIEDEHKLQEQTQAKEAKTDSEAPKT